MMLRSYHVKATKTWWDNDIINHASGQILNGFEYKYTQQFVFSSNSSLLRTDLYLSNFAAMILNI